MTLELSPKLLDFVEFPDGDAEAKKRGTIVDLIGEEALVEISDDEGVPSAFVVRSVHDLAKVAEVAKPAPENVIRSEGQVYFENAVLLLQNKLVDLAKEQFRKAFLIDPKFRGTLLNLTNNLGTGHAFDAAIVLYKLLLELSPDYNLARENLAITFLNRGVAQAKEERLLASIEDFHRVLMLNPSKNTVSRVIRNLVASYTQLGVFDSNARRYERAFQWFQMALELDPSDIPRKNLAVALIAAATQRAAKQSPQMLDQIFREPLLMGLSLSACWTAYGATVAGSGNLDEARRAFLVALEADANNDVAKHNLEVLSAQHPEAVTSGLTFSEVEPLPPLSVSI